MRIVQPSDRIPEAVLRTVSSLEIEGTVQSTILPTLSSHAGPDPAKQHRSNRCGMQQLVKPKMGREPTTRCLAATLTETLWPNQTVSANSSHSLYLGLFLEYTPTRITLFCTQSVCLCSQSKP